MKELHWLPIHARIDFKMLLLTYKILNGLALAEFANWLRLDMFETGSRR